MSANMSNASEPDCLLQMGQELATIDPELIYIEAKRQYEALLHARHGDFDTPITRTKKRVLELLDQLGEEFEWAGELTTCVEEFGRDTVFEDSAVDSKRGVDKKSVTQVSSVNKASHRSSGSPVPILSQPRLLQSSIAELGLQSMVTVAAKTPTPTQKRQQQRQTYFIIPTLPIALPTSLFSALGSQGPIDRLTVSDMPAHPLVLLLALTSNLKSMLRNNVSDFWKTATGVSSLKRTTSHTASLQTSPIKQHTLVTREGDEVEGEEEGNGLMDLGLWIAQWMGARQVEGNVEKGLEERVKVRLSAVIAMGNEAGDRVDEDEGEYVKDTEDEGEDEMVNEEEGRDEKDDEEGGQDEEDQEEDQDEKGDGKGVKRIEGKMEIWKRKRASWNEVPDVLVFEHKEKKKAAKSEFCRLVFTGRSLLVQCLGKYRGTLSKEKPQRIQFEQCSLGHNPDYVQLIAS
ncbi:hypothetical protein K458DRAFT_428524 [Lentithecium fluviatile CBS 122367]|uniref:Uncharacterized protein n=1 Tax=Lentithecium fluviatile CBS 122367 TaxID=1168545 RepID=A0A6G1JBT7_9PLEO|nr:hypothetical protein K458DRAFT_428524 [Lentithecium fluviatile CBS 122367]